MNAPIPQTTAQHGERLARIEGQVDRLESDTSEIKGGLRELTHAVQALTGQVLVEVARLRDRVELAERGQATHSKELQEHRDRENRRTGAIATVAAIAAFAASNAKPILEWLKT